MDVNEIFESCNHDFKNRGGPGMITVHPYHCIFKTLASYLIDELHRNPDAHREAIQQNERLRDEQ